MAPPDKKEPIKRRKTLTEEATEHTEELSGFFRGVAAAMRKAALGKAVAGKVAAKTAAGKAVAAKTAAAKTVAGKTIAGETIVRQIGESRPLAFASEGAVAGKSMLPKVIYYGAWALSGLAIGADIYNKYQDAPKDRKWQTVVYWTTFHVPASLVVPAVIIHEIVHAVQRVVDNPAGLAKSWSPRAKSAAPVAAAMLSIIPVVPAVDTAAEYLLEPTLGEYLGLEFMHHGKKTKLAPRRHTTHSFPGYIDNADNFHRRKTVPAKKSD